ncbi:ABC transporter substrate-binding protein [Streptomyces sp. ACA25]|uniref:ABC transporter substrate-binding protein n=1 Tax=Streptomyces sp. ACA25 TaxID=3022596 RepID=UPI0023076BFD|nr:ABC transporter substrate-binding protein [Streptomyces sp. ACA25]MDB1088290.1 ABC transporter substrate-binding protein [Streptomyces sp. ACA25]
MQIARSKAVSAIAAAVAMGVLATACSSERDGSGDSQPFVFGAAGDPSSLDPSLASDGETFRIARQVLEPLLDHESGTSELVGGLAESWESNDDGTEWTFHLQEDVKFHDGEDLTGEVVCQNFERWYNWSGTYQSSSLSYYWQNIFGGFAENEDEDGRDANYAGCEAPDEHTAVISVHEYSANYPGGFSLAAFGIHSPKSLEAYADDSVSEGDEGINYPDYSQEAGAIAGTGPFEISEWNKGNQEVVLERFDDYWGDNAGVETLIFKTVDEEATRRQDLQSGAIHGYDLVAPADVTTLEADDFIVPTRDVFNIFYLAFTQDQNEALEDLQVRQAIAHALDKSQIVDSLLPDGGTVATQFMPETVDGFSEDVPEYPHDPDRARELLADAGHEDLEVSFCYPTEVTRPYMPAPEDIYQVLKADLTDVGISVVDKPMKWNPDYIDTVYDGGCELHILGWTGDFNDGYNFLGAWFAAYDEAWGFRDDALFASMEEANREPDYDTRVELYKTLNAEIMEFLPGVPISSSPPSIAFSPDVNPPNVSPLTQEKFAEVSFK